jgi:hypothetical protein
MSPESISILLGALTAFVVSTLAFGHRFADKCGKFDEKSKIDELNGVRKEMRADSFVSAFEKIWAFLREIDRKMGVKDMNDIVMNDISESDTAGKFFQKLINDLEQTFRDDVDVRTAWENLRIYYGKLGKILYWFAAIVGLAGYSLLFLAVQANPFLSQEQYSVCGGILFIVAVTFIGLIVYVRRKISYNSKIYDEFRKKYLIDEVKFEK